MIGEMAAVGKGAPIEAAICEALDAYQRKHGQPAEVVRIHHSNPASVDVPEGVELEFVGYVQPGYAWAGRVA